MKKFEIHYKKATNSCCSICFKLGKVMTVSWYTQDYRSNKRKGKICKTLQKHPHSIWICDKCLKDLRAAYFGSLHEQFESEFGRKEGKDGKSVSDAPTPQ